MHTVVRMFKIDVYIICFQHFMFNVQFVVFLRCSFDLWDGKRAKMHCKEKGKNMHKTVKITMQRNEKNGNVKVAERRMAVDVFLINIFNNVIFYGFKNCFWYHLHYLSHTWYLPSFENDGKDTDVQNSTILFNVWQSASRLIWCFGAKIPMTCVALVPSDIK